MMLSLFNLIFLTRIPHKALRREKRIINYRLSRGRKIQTNLLGILATRWRFYHAVIIMDEPVVTDVILATVALHNILAIVLINLYITHLVLQIVRVWIKMWFVAHGGITPHENLCPKQYWGRENDYSISAKAVWDTCSEYFFNEGPVSWQWDLE